MFFRLLVLLSLALVCVGLWTLLDRAHAHRGARREIIQQELPFDTFFQRNVRPLLPAADGFDWPLNPPDGDGVTIAEGFLHRNAQGESHVGENWRPPAPPEGASTGAEVRAAASGLVLMAMDFDAPWGGVVSVASRPGGDVWPPVVEIVYAHLATLAVKPLERVTRGQVLGTLQPPSGEPDGDGIPHHLHWEVRPVIGLGLGPTHTAYPSAWIEPRAFVAANRPPGVPEDDAYGKMQDPE